jgi:flagellar assembly protein FliH
MATIIRTSRTTGAHRGSAFNFDDMAAQAGQYLDEVRQQAERILSDARSEADHIRLQAEAQGKQDALDSAERVVESRIAETLLPALRKLAIEVDQAKESWVAQWERELVQLASGIAEKVVRCEIERHPKITLDLIRESLAMAAGSPRLKVRLSPKDFDALGSHVTELAQHVGAVGAAEVVADASISAGGCRVESEFGVIDQQIESQIARIAEELT